MRAHTVADDEGRRIDLICRREYGSRYSSTLMSAIIDVNPTVDFLTLEVGEVINIPTLEEIAEA